jgi:hypothetical protein
MAGGWTAASTLPSGGAYVAPQTDEVQAPVERWQARPTGWAVTDAGHAYAGDVARHAPWAPPQEEHGAGNAVWMLLAALTAGGVLAVVYKVYWYRRLVLVQATVGTPVLLHHPAMLLDPGYGQWRLVIPIAAAALIGLSLFSAVAWWRQRYPWLVVQLMRLAAFAMVGTTVAAQIARTPKYSGLLQHAVNVAQARGAVYSYNLSVAGWYCLIIAVVALLFTFPVTSRIR